MSKYDLESLLLELKRDVLRAVVRRLDERISTARYDAVTLDTPYDAVVRRVPLRALPRVCFRRLVRWWRVRSV